MPLNEQWYYPYTPLQPGFIRLLKLDLGVKGDPMRGTLMQVDPGKTSFIALSYTWGDPKESRRWAELDGRWFHIRPNLFDALKAVRALFTQNPKGARPIWIDAICLDQDNIPERNAEIACMDRIYAGADKVLVWLGEQSEDSTFAMLLIQSLAGRPMLGKVLKSIPTPINEEIVGPLINLCRREYWYRAWTQQEIAMSKSHMFLMCGEEGVQFDDLLRAYNRLLSLGWHGLESTGAIFALLDVGGLTMEDLLTSRHPKWHCSDKRDIVFSILSMASDRTVDWTADYGIPLEWLLFGVLRVCKATKPNWLASALSFQMEISRKSLRNALLNRVNEFEAEMSGFAARNVQPSIWRERGLDYMKCFLHLADITYTDQLTERPLIDFKVKEAELTIRSWNLQPGDAILEFQDCQIMVLFRTDILGAQMIGIACRINALTYEQFLPKINDDDLQIEKLEQIIQAMLAESLTEDTEPMLHDWVTDRNKMFCPTTSEKDCSVLCTVLLRLCLLQDLGLGSFPIVSLILQMGCQRLAEVDQAW